MAAGYKDFTAGAVLTAADLEDYCQNQATMRFASAAARDSALSTVKTEGMRAYLIDTNTETVYSGSAWSTIGPVHGALATWTPSVTQSGSVAVTVTLATYMRIGRLVFVSVYLSVTGTGTGANTVTIGNLPFTGRPAQASIGTGRIEDSSASLVYHGVLTMNSTTTFALFNTSGAFAPNAFLGGSGFTAALASGDVITFSGWYEAAADA